MQFRHFGKEDTAVSEVGSGHMAVRRRLGNGG